jgi:ActR/RegA family two-component response regulator
MTTPAVTGDLLTALAAAARAGDAGARVRVRAAVRNALAASAGNRAAAARALAIGRRSLDRLLAPAASDPRALGLDDVAAEYPATTGSATHKGA